MDTTTNNNYDTDLRLTTEAIAKMPVIESSQFDDLILKNSHIKIWVSRITQEDGAPYDSQITVEALNENIGSWVTIDQYNPAEVA